jgi:hypothetical protein
VIQTKLPSSSRACAPLPRRAPAWVPTRLSFGAAAPLTAPAPVLKPGLPAAVYARALNQAVWREIGEVEVNEHVEAHKDAFMAAARASLATV